MKDSFQTFPKLPKFAKLTEEQGNIESLRYCLDVVKWKQRIEKELRGRLEEEFELGDGSKVTLKVIHITEILGKRKVKQK